MYFKGDIIITDPCYIMPNEKTGKPQFTDFLPVKVGSKQFKDFTEEENTQYKKFLELKEKWEKDNPDIWRDVIDCFTGEGMADLGVKTFIWRTTLYGGDWSCTTYEENTNKVLGHFCADAGLVAVFLLNEVLKFNPEFDYHIKPDRDHTTTLIRDFDGDIHDEIVEDEVRIIGKGNINFFTLQTGL